MGTLIKLGQGRESLAVLAEDVGSVPSTHRQFANSVPAGHSGMCFNSSVPEAGITL